MSLPESDIAARLAEVSRRVAEAARAAGRDPASVRLVAVSKLQPIDAIAAAHAAGQRDFGENYAQELRDKSRALPALLASISGAGATTGEARPRWHFIGPLQRNKVKYVVGVATLVHSVDSLSLLEEIGRRASAAGLVQPILIEVNVGAEPQKAGVLPEEVPSFVDACAATEGVRLEGFMCIPPALAEGESAESTRVHFRALANLRDAERARTSLPLAELSMGMTADFPEAVAEGATLVRVGTAIFGDRPPR